METGAGVCCRVGLALENGCIRKLTWLHAACSMRIAERIWHMQLCWHERF